MKWPVLSCLLTVTVMYTTAAQKSEAFLDAGLRQQPFYTALPATYYVAVFPVNGCFSCEATMHALVKGISPKESIVLVYPAARKVVQEKIKRENKLDAQRAIYVFDDKLYRNFYDGKKPKGYMLKVWR